MWKGFDNPEQGPVRDSLFGNVFVLESLAWEMSFCEVAQVKAQHISLIKA